MRTLTFLFADLRDYTAFVERHGDVAATTLIADYRRLVRAEVAKADGAEVKTEGDSFYVVFQGATDAVRSAVAILREADRYSQGRPDRPMRVGIGIHAGEPQPHEGQFVGAAVIVAARLAQQARPGELLVSDVVRALLPKAALPPLQEREGLTLKGIEDAPRAFSVSWGPIAQPATPDAPVVAIEAAAPPDRTMLCPRIIGRETELSALAALLDEVSSGAGRTVLVAGEAGVGKSAFLRRFLELAREKGARTLVGECTEIEARRPFGPFVDAFTAASIPLPSELSQGAPGAQPIVEVERYRVHGAFADALADLAASAPVVVAIEDLHWADSASLELFSYLARKLRSRRVLTLATYRDDELHRQHPLRGALAELKRARLATDVRLPHLTSDELAAMIQETLRLTRAPTTAFREAMYERCEGNPLFVEEVLRALVERGDLEYRDGAWQRSKDVSDLALPDSIRDAVQQRLATLTPTARRALQVAAVIGQRFSFDLLQGVTGIAERELLGSLREAAEAQLIQEEDEADDESYRFRHALTRESVLAELMRRERKLLHLAVGEAIEAGAAIEGRAEQLAYHFDRAADHERAYRYHDQAAHEALRVFAFPRAMEHLERAIELAPQGDPSLGGLQLRLAEASFLRMDLAGAVRAAEAARATFRAAGDVRGEGDALTRLGYIRRLAGETDAGNRDIDAAIQMLEPLGPTVELARAYRDGAYAAAIDERPEAVRLGQKAVATSRAVGADDIRLDASNSLGLALIHAERVEDGLRLLREGLASALLASRTVEADRFYHNLFAALRSLGAAPAETSQLHTERMAHARRHGLRLDTVLANETIRAFAEGDWDEVLRLTEEGRSDAYFSVSRERSEACVLIGREGPEAGLPRIEALRRRMASRRSPQDLAGEGFSALMLAVFGKTAEAAERAGPVAELQTRHPLVALAMTAAMYSALRSGDRAAAERWVAAALARSDVFGHGPTQAARALAEGVRAEIAGDLETALERYLEATRLFEQWPNHPAATLVRQLRADIFARRGERDAARAELEAVLPFWRRAKATWYLGQLRAWATERGIELSETATATPA